MTAANSAAYHTRAPRLQAMAYYNLGRANEALGATADADADAAYARRCSIRNVYSVRFRCRVDLRDDVVELTRDPSQIEMIEGIDVELPQPNICDALPIGGKHTLTF